jgi:hypothetical protein
MDFVLKKTVPVETLCSPHSFKIVKVVTKGYMNFFMDLGLG